MDEAENRSTILVVDDEDVVRELLVEHLRGLGHEVLGASSGAAALAALDRGRVDLVISDIRMPAMSGIDLCARIKKDPRFELLPVILLTGASDLELRVAGLAAGADDLFHKPVNPIELGTRVAALLRVKALVDANRELYRTVQAQAAALTEQQRTLERRVQEQVAQLERLGMLRRFLPPHLADLIIARRDGDPLQTHRSEVTVVFVDLRGFTAFTETSAPDEVMTVLQEYHAAMGRIIREHEGTLERYTGDGLMILFNDPLPVPNPLERAGRMALAMRECEAVLSSKWRGQGYDLNVGFGLAQGPAMIGRIGFDDRWDYTAIGSVVNLAARLCGVARAGQILIPEPLVREADKWFVLESVGEFPLKGFKQAVRTFNVVAAR